MRWPLVPSVGALHLRYSVVKPHDGHTAKILELAGVSELSHQEDASTIWLFDVLGSRWIGDVVVIKSRSLIGNLELKDGAIKAEGMINRAREALEIQKGSRCRHR